MALQPAICAQCNGTILVDDVNLNGYAKCEFCGTSHKVIDVITIDGLPTVKSLLIAANHSIEDGNFEKAVSLFNEILTIKPNCHEAWWGLYVCNDAFDRYYGYQDKYGNSGPMTKAQIMGSTLQKYAFRAIEYAPKDIATRYRSTIQGGVNFVESVKRGDYDKPTKQKSGCYIATAVYGSYECDEVFVLRRFRDDYLANRFLGRWFIQFYYMLSPCLARRLKYDSASSRFIRRLLDKWVQKISKGSASW